MPDLRHTLVHGQSLSVGSQGTPSLSTVSETANTWLVASDGTTAVPLKNSTQQYPHLSLGYRLGEDRPAQKLGFSTHGQGGQSIANLAEGGSTGKYEQSIAYVSAARALEVGAGRTYDVEAVHWIHGESDQLLGTPLATYLAALTDLHADYVADIGAITSQGSVPLICSQTASWAYYNNAARIGLAQLEAARTVSGIYLVGGQYQLDYDSDGLHLSNVGYYHLGELHARAHQAVIDSAGWLPFAPASYDLTQSHIDVTYDVPTGVLEFDTTRIPAQTNMGFSLEGTSADITGVAIISEDTVRLELSQPITEAGAKVGYGVGHDNGSVGLGNLCDGETAVSAYDGARLANWALHSLDTLDVPAPVAQGYRTVASYYIIGGNLHRITDFRNS